MRPNATRLVAMLPTQNQSTAQPMPQTPMTDIFCKTCHQDCHRLFLLCFPSHCHPMFGEGVLKHQHAMASMCANGAMRTTDMCLKHTNIQKIQKPAIAGHRTARVNSLQIELHVATTLNLWLVLALATRCSVKSVGLIRLATKNATSMEVLGATSKSFGDTTYSFGALDLILMCTGWPLA